MTGLILCHIYDKLRVEGLNGILDMPGIVPAVHWIKKFWKDQKEIYEHTSGILDFL
jgi:hypothetical protein